MAGQRIRQEILERHFSRVRKEIQDFTSLISQRRRGKLEEAEARGMDASHLSHTDSIALCYVNALKDGRHQQPLPSWFVLPEEDVAEYLGDIPYDIHDEVVVFHVTKSSEVTFCSVELERAHWIIDLLPPGGIYFGELDYLLVVRRRRLLAKVYEVDAIHDELTLGVISFRTMHHLAPPGSHP